jgi:hypothetical protein
MEHEPVFIRAGSFLHQLRICRRSIDEVKLKSLFNEDGYRPYRSADRNLLFFV